MSLGQCSCLECGTVLRVRDRSFVGRVIACPDCGTELLITQNDNRELVAQVPQRTANATAAARATTSPVRPRLRSHIEALVRSPLVLAWLLAAALTAFIAIQLLRPAVTFRPPPTPGPPIPLRSSASASTETPATPSPAAVDPSTPADASAEPRRVPPAESGVAMTTTPAAVPETPMTEPAVPPAPAAVPEAGPKPAPAPPRDPAPPLPARNIAESLQLNLVTFRTDRPNPRKTLLIQVGELAGVPIRYSVEELGAAELERAISLDLKETTVEGVLKAIAEPAGWRFELQGDAIHLSRRASSTRDRAAPSPD